MRFCFVGHAFHRRTGSSAFFVDILGTMGEVTELDADPDGDPAVNDRLIRTLINSRFDCYIFWQTERIAERLLPFDLGPAFIVPMYDSSGHVPDVFWTKFVKHRFLSFTRAHHERLQGLGCATSYFQYFPDPGPEPERRVGTETDAFFWERQPAGAVNLPSVLAHCRALGVDRLLLHAVPDFAAEEPGRSAGHVEGVELAVSGWLDRREDFVLLAGQPLFFFAPRALEGIGMASLEAMARGQIVVAPDLPATNEYVAHLASGLLYDPDAPQRRSGLARPDADILARMSRAARRKAVEGRRTWLADVERLKSIVSDDGRRWSTTDDSAHFARAIRHPVRPPTRRIPAQSAPAIGVSVVTIGLNAAKDLPLTLESVIGQDHPNLEILVFDGMSWDDSPAVLQRYAGAVDRIVTREDAGIYYAMNEALELVSKEYVLFMNAGDQFYCANAVSRMVAALDGSPDIFYGNHIYVGGRREFFRRSAPFELIADRLAQGAIEGNWLDSIPGHQATFARADLLRRLRFDTRLRISADHELLFRAHERGARMQYIDELVCHYFGGGFSVQVGERTKLEGVSVYRRFSDKPELVDKHFYPHGAPFDPHTRRTGVKLGGFFPEETWMEFADRTRGGDWVAGAGCELLSPERVCTGLELIGHNGLDDQHVDFLLGDDRVATAAIPRDHFRIEVPFDRPVPPSSVVAVRPARLERIGQTPGVEVALALRAFRFAGAADGFAEGLAPGVVLHFQSGLTGSFIRTLGTGWSAPERTHLWGVGPVSDLWLKLAASARRFRITVSGNPHVPEGIQNVALIVNGATVTSASIDRGGHASLIVDCLQPPWRLGEINHVALRPSAIATPPADTGDTRPLSICLWNLAVE